MVILRRPTNQDRYGRQVLGNLCKIVLSINLFEFLGDWFWGEETTIIMPQCRQLKAFTQDVFVDTYDNRMFF